MKKVIYLLIIIFSIPLLGFSQKLDTRMMDPGTGEEILIGNCTRDGLMYGTFGELYKQYYPIYEPDKAIIKELKRYKGGLEIVIVLGTWCEDSQEQVPKFLKVLDMMKFDPDRLTLICVDREKQGIEIDISEYEILYVPTFIFLRNGKEIGRIVETPIRSLEGDMLAFVGDD